MENDSNFNKINCSTNCLICCSVFNKPPVIKVESSDLGESKSDHVETDYTSKYLINFLLNMLLEIAQSDELINKFQFSSNYNSILRNICEQCTKLITQAKQIYSQITQLTQKFRSVQKQIMEKISNPDIIFNKSSNPLNNQNENLNLNYFHQILVDSTQNDFNAFGYPFVVNEVNPTKLSQVLPNLPHDGEDLLDNRLNDKDDDLDHKIDTEVEPDSDSKPESPPKPVKRPKRSSNVPKNRKSPSNKCKPVVDRKSKFDRLHPEYPKLLQDPSTGKFHCPEPNCEKSFPRKDGLEGHIMSNHLKDKLFKCNWLECGKSFLKAGDLQNHIDKHEGKPRWKCMENPETCDKAFYYPGDLLRHKQIYHETEKSWICEICGKGFSCRQTLGTHKIRRHRTKSKEKKGNSGVKFICEDCGKEFTLKKNLQAHVDLVHRKFEGKFGCHVEGCEEKFAWKFHLKSHLWRRHKFSLEGYQEKIRKKRRTEETQCKVRGCRKPFMSEESLRRHMEKKHGGDKEEVIIAGVVEGEFKCKFCGKGFHLKGKLKRHVETHENLDTKPYKCELCGKGFSIMQYLKNHLKSGAHNKNVI